CVRWNHGSFDLW
nr:immunoglobulin heavy chain junction region [Macaca mulatta]